MKIYNAMAGFLVISAVLSLIVVNHVFGSSDTDSEDNGGAEDNNGAEDSSEGLNTLGSPAYVDPQGRFSIGFPVDAVIKPLEDVPGGVVSFSSNEPEDTTSIDVRVSPASDTQLEVREHVGYVLAGLQNSSIPNFGVVQNPECEKYTLSNAEACTFMFSADIKSNNDNSSLQNKNVLQLYSAIDDNLYNLIFSAAENDFSARSNIFNAMVGSFEALGEGESGAQIPRFDNSSADQNPGI